MITKHSHTDHDGCWSRLPVYRSGGRLTAEQLESEQSDADLRERLLNLALHGTGVVHGFGIATDENGRVVVKNGCIHVGCGLALDRYGRTLFTADRWLSIDDLMPPFPDGEGCYTLSVHYAERHDRPSWDPCEDTVAWKHRCVVFSLKKDCEPACKCPACLPPPSCDPRATFVCERTGMISNGKFEAPDLKEACAAPSDLVRCNSYHYDPVASIPLACLAICRTNKDAHDCDPVYGFCDCEDMKAREERPEKWDGRQNLASAEQVKPSIEEPVTVTGDHSSKHPCSSPSTCELRPVAYRAPLLYELINDTDVILPKLSFYSWKQSAIGEWDTRMSMEEFQTRVRACTFDAEEKCDSDPAKEDGFYVAFDRPVDVGTLHPLSVIMEVYLRQNKTNTGGQAMVVNWEQYRVPLLIKPDLDPENDRCAIGFHICISEAWLDHIIGDIRACSADGQLARVEITLRGQMIRDKCGCMMDARPLELECREHCGRKTGQARPGGDLTMVFRVGPEFPKEDDVSDDDREIPDKGDLGDLKTASVEQVAREAEPKPQDGGRVSGVTSSRNGDQG